MSSSRARWWPVKARSFIQASNPGVRKLRANHLKEDEMPRVPWLGEAATSFPSPSTRSLIRTPTGQEGRGRATALAPGQMAIGTAMLAALIWPHAAFASAGGDVDPFVYRFTV